MKCDGCVNHSLVTVAMVVHIHHSVKEKSARRFPEISRQAKALGVHRYHLWCVLTARRVSPTLVARYEALTGKPHVFLPTDGAR